MNQHCVDWNGIPEEVAPSGVGKRVLGLADEFNQAFAIDSAEHEAEVIAKVRAEHPVLA